MDSELYAIYKALVEANRQAQTNREIKNAYIFIDSQAAIKRLLNLSKTGGQHTTWKVYSLVDKLSQQNISTKFYWVPGHYGIYGNEMADKAAKAAQEKEVIEDSFTSLSYLKRKIRENTLQEWKEKWEASKSKGKHYSSIVKDSPSLTLKAPKEKIVKRTHSAYYQLKLGRGFFKSFTSKIGDNPDNKCLRECDSIQTPRHLVLYCKKYQEERKILEKALLGLPLSLENLFSIRKGREALIQYLSKTEIATYQWLQQMEDGSREDLEGTS